ncbi:hypothetical protein CJ739_1127 [Mariniflexile rhizosphaerae]|uniref:hypothetical protein n=1 Tax=unclassified Mariniflexile TaxID=2643887 RepID=UPI000CB65C79|nr:hypothetical protein [Mariniflexile sp. TRM1-10]AXP80218.1 hypothetical protein CJ739_1127 [Mariniflexile sp. TRM1-10]PLB19321.1 MAG: hypothetical protein TRG1_1837 [Flavobacteriaceae bacterium FS1-H7996/R]
MEKAISIFLLSLFVYGCSSNDEIQLTKGDYLIFGHFYGYCIGESCVEIFKLTNEKLYEDSNDNYANEPFNFEVLDTTKFEAVKDLIDYFPTKLLSEKESTLGCPDYADAGGLFIEYSRNGTVKSWRIDQIKGNVPSYLHNFMDKVNEKISLINE